MHHRMQLGNTGTECSYGVYHRMQMEDISTEMERIWNRKQQNN